MENNVVLTMRGITMTFPGVKALDKVDFTLRKGEIHALMGENGAGKSTLIKCLTGINDFEAGEIRVDGVEGPVKNTSTLDAQKVGISTVYQEVNLCPNLSVAENLYIGREPMTRFHTIDRRAMFRKADELVKRLGIKADVTQNLENYSLAIQQMIAIARAVDMDCKVLILDEPTSSLDDSEVEKLFTMMRRLKEHGVGIIFVTHFLEQVYAVCDRITVLRDGTLVGEWPVSELPRVKLVAAMMGKDFDDLADIKPEGFHFDENAPMEIQAEGLSHKGTIKPFNLNIRKGEVIGLTGLLGSGRSELARTIYGADRAQTGKLEVAGKEAHIKQPLDAMNLGMGLLPDDRKAEGIIGDLSVRENIILALQAKRGMFRQLPRAKQEEIADRYIDLLQIKTASRETPIKQLSGGNQQKAILARWLATDPDFLILDEPTRGIDVGTKTEIQKLIVDLAAQGKSVMFISSEIEEMLRTCNRMAVLRDGAMVGELDGDLTQERVMAAIAGGANNDQKA
ncbi:sugar ABC transporter ATP-binding protein [Subdoligranulum variabile]|uniref:ABC transporter, ATP-binding protein n=1 Tax=Subdoligranulum variabile DSM 15176 TaxID=411471 RepID=D1PQX3_9FIRM|nr:sugar ABC transporter ATP-binding protein [Subdoligranulum variabile]EFB74820.1 ABC transporter, ATP-binding protein [Subdoligranulum variabile DSM 15176]UWP67096.1 sugar ABC transporter ATP-binding protein [Subdoligranulum variabile]